ncbi:MAG TPA: hypothetical protein VFJ19_07675 [Nocardioidaceae bacterium]|nr:hypothetical protein [Nocardioidaceae bacterium]
MTDVLPAGACLLHIGPYKTGSSAIQDAMHAHREQMREHGVLYPGDGRRADRAGWAVLGRTPRGRVPARIEEWESLVEEVDAARDMRVCVSTEDFGRAGPRFVKRIATDLGVERLYVIAVARRLDGLLPSQWQQRAQSHHTESYDEFLNVVLAERPSRTATAKAFWSSHDLGAMIDRWSTAVGSAERVIVVVADKSDRGLLPRTFEDLLGLPAGMLVEDAVGTNPSLSLNGVELLRRVNLLFAERGWSDEAYMRLVQRGMIPALKAMSHHPGADPLDLKVPPMPPWAAEAVAELSRARFETLTGSGVRVIGDPDTLMASPDSDADADYRPGWISVDAAALAVQGVVEGAFASADSARKRHARALKTARRETRKAVRNARTGTAGPGVAVAQTSGRDLAKVIAGRALRRLRRPTGGSS